MQNSFKPADETTLETEARTEAGTGSTADVTYWLECNAAKMSGASAYAAGCGEGGAIQPLRAGRDHDILHPP